MPESSATATDKVSGGTTKEGSGLSTTSLFELNLYGECGRTDIGCRGWVGVAGMGDADVLFNRCHLRVTENRDLENESDRAGLEMESDIKMESARMTRY